MREALRRLGSLGFRGVVGIFVIPPLLPCMIGASLDGELSAPARVLTIAAAALFLTGWLFLLTAVLPERWGRRLVTPMILLGAVGTLVMGGAALWGGVDGLINGTPSETGESWGYLVCGVFFLGVALLLAVRNKLPWNRGDSAPLARAHGHGSVPSRVVMRDGRGGIRALDIGTNHPSRDVVNARGQTIPSRVAWRMSSGGLEVAQRVIDGAVQVPDARVVVTESVRAGEISFLMSPLDTPVARMWAQALPVQLQEDE